MNKQIWYPVLRSLRVKWRGDVGFPKKGKVNRGKPPVCRNLRLMPKCTLPHMQ